MRTWVVVLAIGAPVTAFGQSDPTAPTPPPAEASVPAVPETPEVVTGPAPDVVTDAPPPSKYTDQLRFMVSDLTILRLNPTGLETRLRVGAQKKLYPSDKKITENNFWFVGAFPKLNPAGAHLALGGELQPASIFNLRVFGEVSKYFGTFGYMQSFTSANANYSDHTLAANADNPTPATEPEAARSMRVSVQPMLQLKFGNIALRSLAMFDYWSLSTRNANAYEPTLDTLLPDNGWTVATDSDLLYVTDFGLAAGLRHSWVKPIYASKHFADAADEAEYDGQNAHQRLGLFGAYTLRDDGPSRFNKPTLVLIVSWYLTHKYRAGEPAMVDPGHTADDYRTRAFPYFIAGFAFESDFLPVQ